MGNESMAIQSTAQRPPKPHFNQDFFNNYNATSNYSHIGIDADVEVGQLVYKAQNSNYFDGTTTGLIIKPDEHMAVEDGNEENHYINPMINLIPTTCQGYTRCMDQGEPPKSTWMGIA